MPGDHGPYAVFYHPLVVQHDIPALSKTMKARVKTAIEQRLAKKPLHYGKPLRYSYKGHRRLRVGDWRIVYRIDQQAGKVIVLLICHRKDVYFRLDPRIEKRS